MEFSKLPKPQFKLMHAHFFFVDIVGLSDPAMSTRNQVKKIEVLNKSIKEAEVFSSTPDDRMLTLPTGDGMCLGFLQGPELPLHLAVELQHKLFKYNKGKIPSETIRIRIGLHSGSAFIVKDVKDQDNIWGPGVILARRVMDIGDDNHILLSPKLAEELRELSDEYRKIIWPVHDYVIKHGKSILIYSAFGKDFGNKEHPKRGAVQKSKYEEEIKNLQKTTMYPFINVEMEIIDPKKMLVRHKRTYEIVNISEKPLDYLLHGIATDVELYSISDLHLQAYDEKNRELPITSINIDKPFQKEFTTRFPEPVLKEETGRKYTIIYQVEEPERNFENAFLVDAGKFSLNFKYPTDCLKCEPKIYEINQETGEKTKPKEKLKIVQSENYGILRFSKVGNMKGESIGIDW